MRLASQITIALGQTVAQRFLVESVAGSGGMGTVFRARDMDSGTTVALKVLRAEGRGAESLDRFNREVQLLSQLNHPRIVRYVSHGQTEQGQPFLVMDWLQGEDLSARLCRGRLSLRDTLAIARQLAEALASVHQLGIVHRDIKPSNLFLRDGDLGQIVLLDFGIAQQRSQNAALTRDSSIIGTPGYMAPEQACGERTILPSADIFSLGCVLFECLAGIPPFISEHIAGVLAKVLFENPPPIRTLRAEVPEQLATLLNRMLLKAPQQRVIDGSELLSHLQELDEAMAGTGSVPLIASGQSAEVWLADEQWLCTVVVAAPRGARMGSITLGTEEIEQDASRRSALRDALLNLGARAEWLPDGSLVAALTAANTGSANDQATSAARAAVLLRDQWPQSLVVMTTGRAEMQAALPVGEVIDRAMRQLHDLLQSIPPMVTDSTTAVLDEAEGVLVDELSADLLDPGFELVRNQEGIWLQGERATADETRLLLGRPTPCVGREQELRLLNTMLSDCIKESHACAILIKAPPGLGKSRLRHEFLRRLEHSARAPEVLFGRGDSLRGSSTNSLLGQALRQLADVQAGGDTAAQQAKLCERLGRFLDEADRPLVSEFLAELCNLPFMDGCTPLRTARRDPTMMVDWLTRAFVTWVRAESRQRPMLIVLEDLHWGDPLSLKLIDAALRELHELPLMVLALARQEVDQTFPGLWAERVQSLSLRSLGKRASETLIKLALGNRANQKTTQRIVQQAAGNALFLEELIRAAVEPTKDAPSDTLVALLQARIGRLQQGARRALITASLFGYSFWRGGIRALLGMSCTPEEINDWLTLLVEAEIISRHRASRFVGDPEYGFRHALMRDAAYSLLTDASRKQGHRLAGTFVEAAGEQDALVLAEHFDSSDEPARAVPWYIRAADREIAGNDLDRAWLCIQRSLQCGASAEYLGVLRSQQCTVHFWRHDWIAVCQSGADTLPLLAPGSLRWCTLVGYLLTSLGSAGRSDEFARMVQVCAAATPDQEARSAYLEAVAWLVGVFTLLGQRGAAGSFLERISQLIEQVAEDEYCLGWASMCRAIYSRSLEADPWGARVTAKASAEAFHKSGSVRNWLLARALLGFTEHELGRSTTAERILRETVLEGQQRKEPLIVKYGRAYLAWILASRPDPARLTETGEMLRELVERPDFSDGGNSTAHCALALRYGADGDLQKAESHAVIACQNSASMPVDCLQALTVLIRVYQLQRRPDAARAPIIQGMLLLEQVGCAGYAEVGFRLAAAEVYHAEGELAPAHRELQETLRQIRLRSARIPDAAVRAAYWTALPENAHALRLARSWFGHDRALAESGGDPEL